MANMWNSSVPQLVLWGTVLLLMLAAAYFVLRRLRDSAVEDKRHPAEMLANFQEMKLQGDINDAEYRTIQSLLKSPATKKEKQSSDNT